MMAKEHTVLNRLLNDPGFASSAPYASLRAMPLGYVDVGARGGVHPLLEPLAGVTAVLGFEPDLEECARMQEDARNGTPWSVCDIDPSALAAGDGDATLYLLAAATNHSLRRPNEAFTGRYNMVKFEQKGIFPLRTTSLDKLLFGSRQNQPFWGELLKLDTQGTEFEILQGAQRTLQERTVAVLSEVEFCQIYKGQKLFSEIELMLRECGFSFYGFTSMHYRSCRQLDKRIEVGRERALYADAVFLKDPLPGGFQRNPLSDRGVHVLFSSAMLLGFYDFALELALKTWAEGAEAKRIESLVRRYAAVPPQSAYNDVITLAERVRANPDRANVAVGRFVDQYRQWCDYDDISL